MSSYIQVITTTDKQKDAVKISHTLVEEKLAACVQIIGPIISVYTWKDKIEQDEEWQCVIKTRTGLYPKLEARIREIHPYEVPEILAFPIEMGNADYFDWLVEQTQKE